MGTKRTKRVRRLQGSEVVRPSVMHWLATGDTSQMKSENGWMLICLPTEARAAHARGDHLAVRRLLAGVAGGHNYFVRG